MCFFTNELTNTGILCLSDKLVISRLPGAVCPIFFSFLILLLFHISKVCEISQQSMGNSENIGHIVLENVP